jgi:trk system potassium uptake protein TrkH
VDGLASNLKRWLNLWRRLSPPVLFILSFAVLIAIGTLGLLVLPGLYRGHPLGPLDALFTITSAVCVTGLIVVDTATHFTFWGQLWLLVFIQLGGLGLITLTSLIIGALGRRLSLQTEMISTPAQVGQGHDVLRLTLIVARFTFLTELAGAACLFVLWLPRFSPTEALWHAVFQAVSAFCNAGFSTFSDSLMGFNESPATLLVISALIITGGLGFLVVTELSTWYRAWARQVPRRLSSHSYAAVLTTAALLGLASVLFALFEWRGVLAPFSVPDKLLNAWFMAVTPRTCGFNTISYAHVGNDTAFLTILLMLIGGSPGSTAGGLKTTTFAVLVALAVSRIRGRQFVEVHDRGVPRRTLEQTVSLVLLAVAVLIVALFALNFIESSNVEPALARRHFLPQAFEAVSAFGTVGLSMDVTSTLTAAARAVLILLMFIGRVGLLSFFSAMTIRTGRAVAGYRPAQEDLVVG